MEFETYEDVIDAFENGVGVIQGESLTDYIKRNNIKIKEIKMSPLGDLKKIIDAKDGGAIGIEVLFKDKMAKGGRVGFQAGGSGNWWDGLTGEAKGIYDSMTAYGASDEEIQAKLQAQNLWSPGGTTTDTAQVTGIINQNIGGGGDGDYQGGGKFGNLDLSDTKTFTKDVWSDTAGPPGQFGWDAN